MGLTCALWGGSRAQGEYVVLPSSTYLCRAAISFFLKVAILSHPVWFVRLTSRLTASAFGLSVTPFVRRLFAIPNFP